MTPERQPPESVAAFLKVAPKALSDAMVVLSAAVSLTDDLAYALLGECWHHDVSVKPVLGVLRTCDFAIQRNSEWHIERDTRDFFLHELHSNPSLEASAHAFLARVATGEEQGVATESIPVYIASPVGRAYHSAVADPQLGLRLYRDAYSGRATGDQWLLGELADEQQKNGLLPADAIEPAFFRGMVAYRERRLQDAEVLLHPVATSGQIRLEVAIAQHVLGIIIHRRRHQRDQAEALLRQSLQVLEQIGDRHGQAQVQHTLGRFIWHRNPEEAETLLRQSLEIGREIGHDHHQAQVLHTLGSFLERRNPGEAEALLRQSLEIGREIGHGHHQAQVLHTLGSFLERRNPEEAEALLRQSLQVLEQIGDRHGQAQVLNSRGNSSRRVEAWEKARSFYTQALGLSSHPKDRAVAYLGLSHVSERHDNDLATAMKHMEEAIVFQRQTDRPELVRNHERRLNELRRRIGQNSS